MAGTIKQSYTFLFSINYTKSRSRYIRIIHVSYNSYLPTFALATLMVGLQVKFLGFNMQLKR